MISGSTPVLPPVAIGGVGGSGTRLVAEIVRRLGHYMGDDLNVANDNLWFTLLFKRTELWNGVRAADEFDKAIRVFRAVMAEGGALNDSQVRWVQSLTAARSQHDSGWLQQRVASLLHASHRGRPRAGRWGWKEPNTHIVLDRLHLAIPGMKYIHVMRHGLDMAYSTNQNQLKLWGRFFLGTDGYEVNAYWSVKYWCLVHRRVLSLGEHMQGRFFLLNYDAFCAAPREGLRKLLAFLGLTIDQSVQSDLLAMVRVPESTGRFKRQGLEVFDADDIAYVRSLGFDVHA